MRALFADSGNQIRSKVVGSWLGVGRLRLEAAQGDESSDSSHLLTLLFQLEEGIIHLGIPTMITRVTRSYRKIEADFNVQY